MAFDLDDMQQQVWEKYLAKKNVALFGRAGCGKSTVMMRAINHARRDHGEDRVGVLAWTNHAAGLIGGQTLHKFLRVGPAPLPKESVLQMVQKNSAAKYRIKNVRVMFIDEVSTIASRWFAVLENVVRQLAVPYMQALPWGGCQVIGTYRRRTLIFILFHMRSHPALSMVLLCVPDSLVCVHQCANASI